MSTAAPSIDRKAVLTRRIRWFVAATITYSVIEADVAITDGARVSSTALIGFGLDSVIEISSAAAVPTFSTALGSTPEVDGRRSQLE